MTKKHKPFWLNFWVKQLSHKNSQTNLHKLQQWNQEVNKIIIKINTKSYLSLSASNRLFGPMSCDPPPGWTKTKSQKTKTKFMKRKGMGPTHDQPKKYLTCPLTGQLYEWALTPIYYTPSQHGPLWFTYAQEAHTRQMFHAWDIQRHTHGSFHCRTQKDHKNKHS